jgi:ADP-ribosylglycohydrolase
LGALLRYEKFGDAKTSGDARDNASGNGSIMRLAPVPIRYMNLFPDKIDELVRVLVESSLTTHASPQCLSACAYMGVILAGLIHGLPRDQVLAQSWPPLEQLNKVYTLHTEIYAVSQGSFRDLDPPAINGSGYVVRSLEAALWAFHNANNFQESVLRAVNLGNDADTTGAVCGQLAGAYWGESGIPADLRGGLAKPEMIEKALSALRV